MIHSEFLVERESQKAADVWKKDVWGFQAFSQTFLELRVSLGNEGKDGKNLNSQTWPGTPRRPSSRHPQPPEKGTVQWHLHTISPLVRDGRLSLLTFFEGSKDQREFVKTT